MTGGTDVLVFNNINPTKLTSSYNATTGTLTISTIGGKPQRWPNIRRR
jgi:hypothetical protein